MTMTTVRGQSARIVQLENEKYSIQLYSNGNWGRVSEGYKQEFDAKEQALEYFELHKDCLHR